MNEEIGEEEELRLEEVREAVRKLKERKAMGVDGIPNETWRFGGERTVVLAWEICRRVWRGWPQGWKEEITVPIVKKGTGLKVEEYRGVTLMPTLYKVYASVLARRLEKEVEEKRMVPENQP
ncbi:uncharacterized protein LOC108625382 [Ceratina calcarata]|uniref:Uncharacterized protein LOC108625382 n=1 Tax=Ceratina calcarata TaxID=156304 RepID=A0AAJ7N7L2_9HYME|nr:uncharacterized protein LOC108625382 [Ceratina calcarata]